MDEDEFLFIEETGARHKPATKSRIKTHVMDRVVKQKRPPKTDRTRIRRLESKDSQRIHWQMQNANASGSLAGIEDMVRLASLPIELGTTDTKFILHHFLNTHSPLMCTVASETGWLRYALEDGALFNSTIYYWALLNHQRLPVKFLNEESVIRLKGLAISKINPRLDSASHDGVDDAVIASVACLANVNLKVGNLEEAKIHFQGLKAMIRGRRGLQTLGYQGLIARLLKATDNFHAQLYGTKLSFEEPNEISQRTDSNYRLTFSFDGIVAHLRRIAAHLITSPKDAMTLEERVSIGQRLLASDREILKYIHSTAPCISTVVATGALLYSHAFLRGMEPSFPLIKATTTQLKLSILSACALQGDLVGENPMALVWVLFIGALNSEGRSPDGIWFRLYMENACGADSEWIMECFQELMNQNRDSPRPFYWLLQENWIQLSSVNTAII